jgi:hypothetical protein
MDVYIKDISKQVMGSNLVFAINHIVPFTPQGVKRLRSQFRRDCINAALSG